MRPIVGNKSIEAIEKAVFKPAALPFPAQNMDDIGRLSQSELEGHLTQVSQSVSQSLRTIHFSVFLLNCVNCIHARPIATSIFFLDDSAYFQSSVSFLFIDFPLSRVITMVDAQTTNK